MQIVEAKLDASGKSFAIVAARWNPHFSERLVEGARRALIECGAQDEGIILYKVPGSFEVPFICHDLALSKKYSAIIALGVLIEGETDHYRLIAEQLSPAFHKIIFETGIPIGFGVLACKNAAQAEARAGLGASNKGREAALAALEMTCLKNEIYSEHAHMRLAANERS